MGSPRATLKSVGHRRPHRMAVLAIADEIRAEVSAGAYLTTIYEARRAQLGMSYSQFARLARRYLSGRSGRGALRADPLAPARPTGRPAVTRKPGEPLKLVLAAPAALLDRREAGNGTTLRNHEGVGEDELI